MKQINILFAITALAVLSCSKDKDRDGIGYAIESKWDIQSNLYNGEEIIVPGLTLGMHYVAFNGEVGNTSWYYSNGLGATDTAKGIYWLSNSDRQLNIHWQRQANYFSGFDTLAYDITLMNDTMWLETIDPGGNHEFIQAVRVQ